MSVTRTRIALVIFRAAVILMPVAGIAGALLLYSRTGTAGLGIILALIGCAGGFAMLFFATQMQELHELALRNQQRRDASRD